MIGCIFCGTRENISTSIKVKTARGESTEPVCAAHEDDASPKKVRELVEARDTKIAEMSSVLEPMGYKIVPLTAVLTTQAPPQTITPPPVSGLGIPVPTRPAAPRKINSATKINAPTNEFAKASEGYDTSEAPALIESTVQEVRGAGGIPVMIPKTLISEGGGKTDIRVVNAMNNDDIQKRFKGISDGDTKFKVQDYGLKDCNFCSGTGLAKIGGGHCPRCKGVGQS